MPLHSRDVVPYPDGNTTSSTIINGIYFNRTALDAFGYALYTNKTISNDSKCYLIFDQFKPAMFDNGTWVNATTCYVPYYDIQTRGVWSIVFGALFGLTIVFSMVNLRKHGRVYIREHKRFRVVGRRWQYYWMLFVAACGMISTLTGVDIDRNYLQDLPIILQSFFFTLMMPASLALVWEATRHWGSWQERQIYDAQPFGIFQHDRSAKIRFWLPLVFYTFAFLSFFMLVPRSWATLSEQNSNWQKENIARPSATSGRDKAGSVIAVFAFMIICFSLWHSSKYYGTRTWLKFPLKLVFSIILLAVRLVYGIASSWNWDLSISQVGVEVAWPFGLGYTPILLILVILEIAGYIEENEDRILLQHRTGRERANDADLQITRKPYWWGKNRQEQFLTDEQRLQNLTSSFSDGKRIEHSYELEHVHKAASPPVEDDPFRDNTASHDSSVDADDTEIPSITGTSEGRSCDAGQRAHAQHNVRSMLDV